VASVSGVSPNREGAVCEFEFFRVAVTDSKSLIIDACECMVCLLFIACGAGNGSVPNIAANVSVLTPMPKADPVVPASLSLQPHRIGTSKELCSSFELVRILP